MNQRYLGGGMVAAVLALFLPGTGVVRATIVYDNFAAGNGYNTTTGWPVGNDFVGGVETQAETFTPGTSGTLTRITIAMDFIGGATNQASVALETSSGGQPSGVVLESWTPSGFGPQGVNNPPTILNDVLNVSLTAGTQYWIVASATDPTSSLSWQWNSIGVIASHGTSFDGGATWQIGPATQGAFRVEVGGQGPTVPEPSALTLLCLGGVVLAGFSRLRMRRCL